MEEDPTSVGGMGKLRPLSRAIIGAAMSETDNEDQQKELAQLRQQHSMEAEQLYNIISVLSNQLRGVTIRNAILEQQLEKDQAVKAQTATIDQDEHQTDPSPTPYAQTPSTRDGWRRLWISVTAVFQRLQNIFRRERPSAPRSPSTDTAPLSAMRMQIIQREITDLSQMLQSRREHFQQVTLMREAEATSRREAEELREQIQRERAERERLAALLSENSKKLQAMEDEPTIAKAAEKGHHKLQKQFSKLVGKLKKKDQDIEGLQHEIAVLKTRMDGVGAEKAEENNN